VGIEPQNSIDIESFAQWLKIIGEPNRLRIINLLMGGVQCNCEIGDMLGMAPNLISHHLKVLREEGLVNVERDPSDSRWLYFTLNIEKLDLIQQTFSEFFDPARIQPRQASCGPRDAILELARN
jgi:ArsR family transcriptional regulator